MEGTDVSVEDKDEIEKCDDDVVEDKIADREERREAAKEKLTRRERLYEMLSDPTSSGWALAYAIFMSVCVVVSVLIVILFSFYDIAHNEQSVGALFIVDMIVSIIFTIDYFLRLITCKRKLAFIVNLRNVVDFLSFLPFYIELIMGANGSVREKQKAMRNSSSFLLSFQRIPSRTKRHKYRDRGTVCDRSNTFHLNHACFLCKT